MTAGRARAREVGVRIGRLAPGPANAITDVPGVRVGHATLVAGDGPLVVGRGPVRTGVTVVVPRDDIGAEPVFAGWHCFNGAGEMTGLAWVEESGLLTTPVALTNTHSVGVVRDALIAHDVARGTPFEAGWSLPVVAETYDGRLNDIDGMHVRPEHAVAALAAAAAGPVAEGSVGGGTGMICHGFKGGIGTASRVLPADGGGFTVGVLVQANYGDRRLLRVDGVPIGEAISEAVVPLPGRPFSPRVADGSIIVVVATDAPVLPGQCRRLAQRATVGLARAGGIGANGSGDLFLAFSTANAGLRPPTDPLRAADVPLTVRMLPNRALTPLFEAVAEATEEAIVNALCMATTMTGIDGVVAHALPLDRLRELLQRAGRLVA